MTGDRAAWYRHFARKNPQVGYWVKLGLQPKAGRGLVAAGFLSVDDLRGKYREPIRAIDGVGEGALEVLERHLGSRIPSETDYWKEQGLGRHAQSLLEAGIHSLEELRAVTREQFLSFRSLGERALRSCEEVLGHPLGSPRKYWISCGLRAPVAHHLSRLGIRTPEELAAQTDATLRNAGLSARDIEECREIAPPPAQSADPCRKQTSPA